MSNTGITPTQAEIVKRLGITVKYVDEFMRSNGMGSGRIIEHTKSHATIQPLSKKAGAIRVPLARIRISSLDQPAVTQEYNKSMDAKAAIATLTAQASPEARETPNVIRQVEKPMPPEVAPRPVKAEPIHILPATQPPEPGQGAFMAIAARMDLAARRVEEREQAVKQAGRDLLAAQQLHDEAVAAVKEAKSDLERLGTEFSQRYTGLVGARP